jgi:NHL repeat/WD40-like Beta Propeller Repeat
MKRTEHSPTRTPITTGLVGMLGGFLKARGIRISTALASTLTTALLLLTFAAASAQASRGYIFEKAIGTGAGSGAGQMELQAPEHQVGGGGQTEPSSGVAVNPVTHDVYVADTNNHRVDEFESDGAFVRAWGWGVGGGVGFEDCTAAGLGCKAGVSGSASGEFELPMFVAVDPSDGDVYVGDTGDDLVSKFTEAGVLVSSWGNNGENTTTHKRTEPNGQLNGSGTETFGALAGIAVGATGTLYVINEGGFPTSTLFAFEANGKFTGQETLSEISRPRGLTVDGEGDLFQVKGLQTVEELTDVGGDVGQVTDAEVTIEHPLATAGLAADPATEELFVDAFGTEIARYAFVAGEVLQAGGNSCPVAGGHGCNPTESFGHGDVGQGAGIAVDSSDASVYLADSSSDQLKVFALEPPSAPLLAGLSVTEVTDSSATFTGEIDPHGAQAGYQLQYAPCVLSAPGCEPDTAPAQPLAAGAGFDSEPIAPIHVQVGLQPHTVYHFRLLAENEALGVARTSYSEERTFTTRGTGEFVLPDDRQYQLVSPAARHGALIEPIGEQGVIQAAPNGDALTYLTDFPTESNPEGYVIFQQALSTRGVGGTSSWSTRDITPPHSAPTGVPVGSGFEYRFFSEDLEDAILQPLGAFDPAFAQEASPQATEQTPFLRADFAAPNAAEQCTTFSCYQPLVTAAPAGGDVPEGTVFGQETSSGRACDESVPYCGPYFLGASPDAEHVIFETAVPLTTTPVPPESLYEWSAGAPASERLRLVSLLPANASGEVLPASGPSLGWSDGSLKTDRRDAISPDGERVVWDSDGELYLRENATEPQSPVGPHGECLDTAEGCTFAIGAGLSGELRFQIANREATKIFFTNGGDLYEYDVQGAALNRLTENGEVQGYVIGASEDGTWVYFVANGVLGDAAQHGASHGDCGEAPGDTCNLYAYHDGTITLVAVLSGADGPDWASEGELSGLTARVSPNGEWLAFMSERSLTGYDNEDVTSKTPGEHMDQEVFEYHAGAGGAAGALICASCDPTGGRPAGREYKGAGLSTSVGGLVGGDQVWKPATWIAANVPGWTPFALDEALYQSRYLSNTGRLFFDSSDALVPKDTNETENVYEFEPAGLGTCSETTSTGSSVYVPSGGGCVGLISSGTSPDESAFLDASESGGDVFILTTQKLSTQAFEGGREIYDAHECGAEGVPCTTAAESPSPCETEASCKAAPEPQPGIYGPPPSATFSGPGNLTPEIAPPPKKVVKKTVKCKRNFVKNKKNKCIRKKRKKRAKRAGRNRGTKS